MWGILKYSLTRDVVHTLGPIDVYVNQRCPRGGIQGRVFIMQYDLPPPPLIQERCLILRLWTSTRYFFLGPPPLVSRTLDIADVNPLSSRIKGFLQISKIRGYSKSHTRLIKETLCD